MKSQVLNVLKHREYVYYVTQQAVIAVTGSDAQQFLSRLSTNDFGKLSDKGFLQSSFTNNKGRMIDHCVAILSEENAILLASSHHDPKILMDWLLNYHFIEDVEIHDHSDRYEFVYCISRSMPSPPKAFPIWSYTLAEKSPLTIYAALNFIEGNASISKDAWETVRIMCMMPSAWGEINENVMPHNINLEGFISDTKGCYIGQEVIAKARTYQKHVKTLCGISVNETLFAQLAPHVRVINENGYVGDITSVAPLYEPGEIHALVLSDLTQKTRVSSDILPINVPFQIKNHHKS